ncbi:MAG: Txe/YoeB family addiction module toxin [Bacteroidota bacterium]
MNIEFSAASLEDYQYWQQQDRKKLHKINQLLREISRTPFRGIGKPEALQGDLQGYWSRRIDREHRLVYRVLDGRIQVLACRYHY